MGRKLDSAWSETEMIRSFNEVCHDLLDNWGARVECSVGQGSTRYMLCFRLAAYDDARPEERRHIAQVQWDYPNAKTGSLTAQLFQYSITLARMVEEYRTARMGA